MAKFRSPCALSSSLDIFGDKWTLLIVRDLFRGCSHFKEFQASPEKIASNILSNRLTRLLEHGIIEKYSTSSVSGADAYRLTPKGKSLEPVLLEILEWGKRNIPGTGAFLQDV